MGYKLLIKDPISAKVEMIAVNESSPTDFNLIKWGWDHCDQCPIYATADIPIPHDKFDNNLNHKRKVEFESVLAIHILQQYKLSLPVLQKISNAMIDFLNLHYAREKSQNNHNAFIDMVGGVFAAFFYPGSYHFGRLGNKSERCSNLDAYQSAHKILKRGKHIEYILTAFIAMDAIFRLIMKKGFVEKEMVANYFQISSTIFATNLFKNRGKYLSHHQPALTTKIGITDNSVNLHNKIKPHYRAIDSYKRDFIDVSDFAFEAYQKEIPFVAGPSGHTAILLQVALTFSCTLTAAEMQQYTFACAGLLITAGAHSFHEVYSVAETMEVEYKQGCYEASIPLSFKKTESYQTLLAEYSDIIRPDTIKNKNIEINNVSFFSSNQSSFKRKNINVDAPNNCKRERHLPII
jgi:hypothetical protein